MRVVHLDCKVFTECHEQEKLCGGYGNDYFLQLSTNPREVTCKLCHRKARSMLRILDSFPTKDRLRP